MRRLLPALFATLSAVALATQPLAARAASDDWIAVPRSTAAIELLATIHPGERRSASALVRWRGATVGLKRGARWRGFRVIAIASGRVLLCREAADGCTLEYVGFGETSSPAAAARRRAPPTIVGVKALGEGRFKVARSLLEDAVSSPHRFARGVRIMPHPRGGFILKALSRSHPLSALGLRRNDRLVAINGRALRGVEDALGAYRALRHARHLELGVMRGGERLAVEVEVE